MVLIIASLAFVSTLLGGLFALRLKDKLHLILGFSAGAVIAVAFFDLLPEALALGGNTYDNATIITITAIGFIVYLVLDRLLFLHTHESGTLGATSLSLHSFLDGVAIGLSFQVSAAVGAVVTVAVLTHDFSDGINTVSVILKNTGRSKQAFRWLIVDAIAPVIGAASTMFFSLPVQYLGIILALFAGFFLYIGASDLIPESQHAHPKFMTTATTVLGAGILYVAIRSAGI